MRTNNDAALPGRHTAIETAQLFIEQGGRCAYCNRATGLQLGHKTPRARAGSSNNITNMQWVCKRHNAEKSDKTDEEFRATLQPMSGERGKSGGRKPDAARIAARQAGDTTYLGAACRRGHAGYRYTSNRACVVCTDLLQQKRRRADDDIDNLLFN